MSVEEFDSIYLEEFQNGNRLAFESVYRALKRPVYETVFKLLRSHADAEDICSECFIKLYQGGSGMKSYEHIKGFLYTTSKRLSLNLIKSRQIRSSSHKEIALMSDSYQEWEHILDGEIIFNEMVNEIRIEIENLSKISNRYVQIIELTVLQKKRSKEVAELLGISESTVRNLKANAIKKLQVAFLKKGLLSAAVRIAYIGHLAFLIYRS